VQDAGVLGIGENQPSLAQTLTAAGDAVRTRSWP
jgi:hypothetical protein